MMFQSLDLPTLALVLPVPPSVNHLYATVRGRRILSRDGRAYKVLVAAAVQDWRQRNAGAADVVAIFCHHALSLRIVFYFATALRRDLDGGLKITQDAVCEALGANDNRVVDIQLSKRVDRACPRIHVFLAALPQQRAAV